MTETNKIEKTLLMGGGGGIILFCLWVYTYSTLHSFEIDFLFPLALLEAVANYVPKGEPILVFGNVWVAWTDKRIRWRAGGREWCRPIWRPSAQGFWPKYRSL